MSEAQWVDDAAGPVVRPYAMVRGRTRAGQNPFDLVAFVVSVPSASPHWVTAQPEHRSILALCRTPRSVTEVAARMNLPVGVIRVLLGDLLEAYAIRVREPSYAGTRPSTDLIRQVLEGLRVL